MFWAFVNTGGAALFVAPMIGVLGAERRTR